MLHYFICLGTESTEGPKKKKRKKPNTSRTLTYTAMLAIIAELSKRKVTDTDIVNAFLDEENFTISTETKYAARHAINSFVSVNIQFGVQTKLCSIEWPIQKYKELV